MLNFLENYIKMIKSVPLQVIIYIAMLGVGVFFLVKFCDIFVDSASAIAKKLKIPPLIIGLTIVAMGTSCPELAVSTSDSISTLINGGNANVAIGNVVGSNICNILLVLGLSSIFSPIFVKKDILKKEFPILLGASALLTVFGCFFGINGEGGKYAITRWEAIIFVVLMISYLVYIVVGAIKNPVSPKTELQDESSASSEEEIVIKEMPIGKAIILCLVGIIGIILGGEMVVIGAKGLAMQGADALGFDHDLTEALFGLTIVAVGTSLPELVTSVIAARKGENELALGNVIGSNIFNILFILGIAGTVNPLTTGSQIIVDLLVMLGITVVLFLLSVKGKLGKAQGIILLSLYVLYLAYLITRTVIA